MAGWLSGLMNVARPVGNIIGNVANAGAAATGGQPMYGGPTGLNAIANDFTQLRYGPGVKRTSNAPTIQGGRMNSPDIAAPSYQLPQQPQFPQLGYNAQSVR